MRAGRNCDFIVIGGGIIGISIAREIRRVYPKESVTILEKEPQLGFHASGRNSGVLHAGFYYTADSLKARFTKEGNQAMRDYCKSKRLPLNECGKLVVARNETDLTQMDELLRRGAANGVQLENITEEDARRIEPRVKTYERAIYSPNTATADPSEVLNSMRLDALAEGVRFELSDGFRHLKNGQIITQRGATSMQGL